MSAIISECGLYRYRLERILDPTNPRICLFVMLNPSTADAEQDDPTIRRCKAFAKREGCGRLVVVNLFAYRATSPKDMKSVVSPIGDLNNTHLRAAVAETYKNRGVVVIAWGTHGTYQARDVQVRRLINDEAVVPVCLGKTKSGCPKHPLYVSADAPLWPY